MLGEGCVAGRGAPRHTTGHLRNRRQASEHGGTPASGRTPTDEAFTVPMDHFGPNIRLTRGSTLVHGENMTSGPVSGPADGSRIDARSVRSDVSARLVARGLTVPKASDVLADELRQQILSGRVSPGEALPVGRDLANSSGLSRTAVREALRILEIEGLIEIRPGRAGGAFVRRPGVQAMQRTVGTFVAGRNVKFRSLLEVREAIEPAAAELAARYRTDDDIDRLDEANAKLEAAFGDPPHFLSANIDWHVAVVRASRNDLMYAFMHSLSEAIFRGTDIADFDSDNVREATARAHRRIVDAIREQNPGNARSAMDRHVHAYRVEVERRPVPDELPLDTKEVG